MSVRIEAVEVDGVEWCTTHQGIVDECSDHHAGNCDLADSTDELCNIVQLYIKAPL